MVTRTPDKPIFKPGMRVHFDVDDSQWGRVASDGTVVEVKPRTLLVNADSIVAGIIIKKSEAFPITKGYLRSRMVKK